MPQVSAAVRARPRVALAIGLGAGAKLEAHESFATPDEAAAGLTQALQKGDAPSLNNLFGPGAEAIRVCRGYVDAQIEYASVDRDGDGAGVYAQKLRSDPGTRNGLYWETAAGEPPSPVGAFIANAAAEGYRAASGTNPPYHGLPVSFTLPANEERERRCA